MADYSCKENLCIGIQKSQPHDTIENHNKPIQFPFPQ